MVNTSIKILMEVFDILDMRPKIDFFGKKFIIEPYQHNNTTRVRLYRVKTIKGGNIGEVDIEFQISHQDLDREWTEPVECITWVREWLQKNQHKY